MVLYKLLQRFKSIPDDINLPDQDEIQHTVTRKEPLLANDSLDMQVTLTGNQEKQRKVMRQKSDLLTSQII